MISLKEFCRRVVSESVLVSVIIAVLVLSGHADGSLSVLVIGSVHTVPAVVDGSRTDRTAE